MLKKLFWRFGRFLPLAPFRQTLAEVLSSANPAASFSDRLQWFEQLVFWIQTPWKLAGESDLAAENPGPVRIRFLLQYIERNPDLKNTVSTQLNAVLADFDFVELFAQTGLRHEEGFFSELSHRIVGRFLPRPVEDGDAAEIFRRVFPTSDTAATFENLPPEAFSALVDILFLTDSQALIDKLTVGHEQALVILSSQVVALSLDPEFKHRSSARHVFQSPFFALDRKIKSNILNRESGEMNWLSEIAECRKIVNDVFTQIENSGVSVKLVFRLESILSILARIETLSTLSGATTPAFIARLIRGQNSERSVTALIKNNLHLLARKIVESTGHTGEHYIARSRADYFAMLRSAAGGGTLTTITTLIKFSIAKGQLALFFEGFFSWLNYSGSFILMQFTHFTLATKQPSMTASALAGKLENLDSPDEFIQEVASITRAQFAAALGNIGLVIPTAMAFDLFFFETRHRHVLKIDYAEHFIHSLHPFLSLTLPLAAWTGVLLFLSSLFAGWAENWIVFNQIPQALAQDRRIARFIGKKGAAAFGEWFRKSAGGLGGNTSLGFLLAFTPVFGRFFGIPLDVRHVTLSTGALTFAFCSYFNFTTLSFEHLPLPALLWALLGIAFIGILNFVISFLLALGVAVRAREAEGPQMFLFLRKAAITFFKRPGLFLFPG
jgi:site-specific recombinase